MKKHEIAFKKIKIYTAETFLSSISLKFLFNSFQKIPEMQADLTLINHRPKQTNKMHFFDAPLIHHGTVISLCIPHRWNCTLFLCYCCNALETEFQMHSSGRKYFIVESRWKARKKYLEPSFQLLLFILIAFFICFNAFLPLVKCNFSSFIPHWLRGWNAFDIILYSPLDTTAVVCSTALCTSRLFLFGAFGDMHLIGCNEGNNKNKSMHLIEREKIACRKSALNMTR